MALKDTWTPKTEFIDDATAADINEVAAAVIAIEENSGSGSGGGGMTENEVIECILNYFESGSVEIRELVVNMLATIPSLHIDAPTWANVVLRGTNGTKNLQQELDLLATKEELDDIETALDEIIAIQNNLIGGASA